ncbi:hypothetical protein ACFE04_019295 [Oxalis oulophora]
MHKISRYQYDHDLITSPLRRLRHTHHFATRSHRQPEPRRTYYPPRSSNTNTPLAISTTPSRSMTWRDQARGFHYMSSKMLAAQYDVSEEEIKVLIRGTASPSEHQAAHISEVQVTPETIRPRRTAQECEKCKVGFIIDDVIKGNEEEKEEPNQICDQIE